jgi:hypothetical protein
MEIVGYSRTFAAAGPPLTDLTAQWDASDGTKLWQTLGVGNPCWSNQATDGQSVKVWQSTVPGASVETPFVIEAAGREPTYKVASTVMPLPSLRFVETDNDDMGIRGRDNSAFSPATAYLGRSAKTILISMQVHSTNTNSGWVVQMTGTDAFGIFTWDSSGNKIGTFNRRSGGTDANLHAISLNTNYVVMMRHDAVNLMSSLNGGAETSVASIMSNDAPNSVQIGSNGAFASDITVGEILFYNACLTGSNLAAAISYMVNKWT